MEELHLAGRQVLVVDADVAGLGQDGIVHVGDVAHHPDLMSEVLEAADHQVER